MNFKLEKFGVTIWAWRYNSIPRGWTQQVYIWPVGWTIHLTVRKRK